jgi:hypothetical protein
VLTDYDYERWNEEDEQPSAIGCNAPRNDYTARAPKVRAAVCIRCGSSFALGDHVIRGIARCRCGGSELVADGLNGMRAIDCCSSLEVRPADPRWTTCSGCGYEVNDRHDCGGGR